TNLSIASGVTALAQPVAGAPDAAPAAVAVPALQGTTWLPATGPSLNWAIRPGTTLVIDAGASQEAARGLAGNPKRDPPPLTALLTKPHAAGAPVALASVPGAPPVFLRPAAVSGPPGALTVRLPVDAARSGPATLAGQYDGIPWEVRPGTALLF